ncbi:MAG: DUF6492 family protein [Ginsengibacter sp.]
MKLPLGQNHPARLVYKNYLKLVSPLKSKRFSKIEIDILIPVAEKDLGTLGLVVDSARQNIINPIGNIFIVGKSDLLIQKCNELNCTFIDENTFLPIKKNDIVYNGRVWGRSGWLFQQLIKLNADTIIKNEHVLVLDSDTCISQQQSFVLEDNKVILNFSDEYHYPYGNYKRFLNLNRRFYLSFVCHHMIFSKSILEKLKMDIETFTKTNWVNGILSNIDFNESSCFSEYETYGNYIYFNYPHSYHLEYWKNKNLKNISSELNNASLKKYKSVSIHKYS